MILERAKNSSMNFLYGLKIENIIFFVKLIINNFVTPIIRMLKLFQVEFLCYICEYLL
jgi:hypothetical protein